MHCSCAITPAFNGKLPKENGEMEGGTGKKHKLASTHTHLE
jgi:hypothetical protein